MRCPVCKAELNTGPSCRRCRADLTMLFQLEDERAQLDAAARHALRQGAGGQAVALADAMAALRPGPDSSRLRALGFLLQGDFASAYLAYREATADGSEKSLNLGSE
jgi:hypothetical protein